MERRTQRSENPIEATKHLLTQTKSKRSYQALNVTNPDGELFVGAPTNLNNNAISMVVPVAGEGNHHEGGLLNLVTKGDNLRWHSKLYDKKVGLITKGLKLNKFPDPSSKLSTRCKYGVITSQLHRYKVANTRRQDFISAAVGLYTAYVDKGYQVRKIDHYFGRFIRSHLHGKMRPNEIKKQYQQMQPGAMHQRSGGPQATSQL